MNLAQWLPILVQPLFEIKILFERQKAKIDFLLKWGAWGRKRLWRQRQQPPRKNTISIVLGDAFHMLSIAWNF